MRLRNLPILAIALSLTSAPVLAESGHKGDYLECGYFKDEPDRSWNNFVIVRNIDLYKNGDSYAVSVNYTKDYHRIKAGTTAEGAAKLYDKDNGELDITWDLRINPSADDGTFLDGSILELFMKGEYLKSAALTTHYHYRENGVEKVLEGRLDCK